MRFLPSVLNINSTNALMASWAYPRPCNSGASVKPISTSKSSPSARLTPTLSLSPEPASAASPLLRRWRLRSAGRSSPPTRPASGDACVCRVSPTRFQTMAGYWNALQARDPSAFTRLLIGPWFRRRPASQHIEIKNIEGAKVRRRSTPRTAKCPASGLMRQNAVMI